MAELMARFGGGFRITVTVDDPDTDVNVPGLVVTNHDGPVLTLTVDPASYPDGVGVQDALARVVSALDVTNLAIEEDDVEDVIRAAFLDQEWAGRGPG